MSADKYVPAIGDRVRIVDADNLAGDEYVGTVTNLAATDPRGWFDRPHPIEVTADDSHSGWYAVEVELIETAAEIAEYEEGMTADDAQDLIVPRPDYSAGIKWPSVTPEERAYWSDVDEMTDVIAIKERGEKWLDDRTPEQVAESDRAIEALRVKFGTDEVRVTSATGGSKGSKVARFDLIPTGPLWELAEHYGKGAQKYERVNGKDNWRNGYDWSLSYAALQRHATAFWNGEDIDPENGSKHIIAAAWHCLALAHFANDEALREQFDDRQDGV